MNLLKSYFVFAGLLLLSNCIFHIAYLNTAAPVIGWVVALRYAGATMAPALFVPGLVYLLAGRSVLWRKFALWFAGLITYYCLTVVIGDLVYYRQAGKHSTIELLLFYQNFFDIARMAMRDYIYVPLVYLALGVLFFLLWRKLVAREVAQHGVNILRRVVVLALFIILSIILARGGLQGRPLRPADAFVHLSQAHGDFALNGVYTSFYSIFHRSSFPVTGAHEDVRAVQKFITNGRETFLSDELPFFRLAQPTGKALKKNVVFIILESWSARRVGVLGDKTGATPFFDSLAAKGWLLTNAFATGRRSIASLPSAVSSIPTLFGSLYITSPHEQNFQRGMGDIFRGQGYSTFFTYAAKAGSMGFNAFARIAGFETILTRESFPAGAAHDGVWGIYDHVMLSRALTDLNAARKPALSVLYTLHPHPPFTLPEGNRFYGDDQPRAKYYNALRYSDNSLRDFFAAAEKSPWFKDTVFVLMADHAFEESQGRDSFRIPLLFYAPGFIAPRRDAGVASELDVLPTLIDLLQMGTHHASMGKSLLGGKSRFAYVDLEHSGAVIRERGGELLVSLFGSEKYNGYYNMSRDGEWQRLNPQEAFGGDETKIMQSYVGVMGFAVAKNKIAPAQKP